MLISGTSAQVASPPYIPMASLSKRWSRTPGTTPLSEGHILCVV